MGTLVTRWLPCPRLAQGTQSKVTPYAMDDGRRPDSVSQRAAALEALVGKWEEPYLLKSNPSPCIFFSFAGARGGAPRILLYPLALGIRQGTFSSCCYEPITKINI